jgi:putative transposase
MFRPGPGFIYVAFAIDLFSRAIVGWQASTVKDTTFVEACLRMALWRRDQTGRPIEPGMIHHSDAGSYARFNNPVLRRPVESAQYTSIRFTETVALEGLTAPIGTVGDAYDNAAAETVMGLFNAKNSPFRTGALKGLPDVEEITYDWVSWYNNERLHSFLGNIPPEEYERNYYAQNIDAPTGDAANKTAA